MRTGAVIIPAPTPVIPIATAIKNPRTISMASLARDMDAALQFFAGPAAGSRIIRIGRQRGAGRTSDAGVAIVVQRKRWDAALFQISPYVRVRPVGERADFEQLLSGG